MPDSVYLDAIATTRISEPVCQQMLPFLREACGLPSGAHTLALEARDAVETSRQQCLDFVGAPSRSICVFTGSGTEANNLGLLGYARYSSSANGNGNGKGARIVTSRIEHPSITRACDVFQRQGHEVVRLDVDSVGRLLPSRVADALQSGDLLVSHLANYDIGTRQNLSELGEFCCQVGAVFMVDATHGAGWNPFSMQETGADIVTFSPHRFFGPAGVGGLVIRPGIELEPLVYGGNQEYGLRPGSSSIANIVGAGAACAAAQQFQVSWMESTASRQREWMGLLSEALSEFQLNGAPCGSERDPHHVSLSIRGVEGEAVLLNLDLKRVLLTSNTGCVTASDKVSPVLREIGVDQEMALGTLVAGLLPDQTREDMSRAADLLVSAVERVRSMSQAWHQFQAGK